ncbi:argininosuccinate lyase [Streptomyces griseochromogenes]|uniref:argininosuccinate lyase n=1 Tax=Streptomyces griseochromogenes TaxID=68214 RepID=A0A1B1AZV1_9ACTN|nr:lyase family protein [Streptomyces griseochromogenes]ANP52070.1 argininosuccinate lyase [Streptomyces griseochromogenes]MBP2056297.1 argininosuccinate lyase [Streptomyces griseochromogenes]
MRLTGRLTAEPDDFIRQEFLEPQFRHEVANLLPWYVLIEKALLREYHRMGVLSSTQVGHLAGALDGLTQEELTANAGVALSDIALAMETRAAKALPEPVPAWHVDRSRNDLQACAQLLYGRAQVSEIAAMLGELTKVAHERAAQDVTSPMPGYTQLQSAQIITPGFYLSAVVEHALHVSSRLLATYDRINFSPLGAGPMAGQELAWDRNRLARAIGCDGPVPHSLAAVASREWLLDVASDIASAGVGFSRFLTDLMAWSSSAYGLVELPDGLAGISAAMPQKKNYPLLERLRGRTGHLTALYVDFATGQRNTPYSNMVEVSKEAGLHASTMFATVRAVLTGFTLVIDNLRWRTDRMRAACEEDHFGGFSLANELTLRANVPWRTAQVIAGRYVTAVLAEGDGRAGHVNPAALGSAAWEAGYALDAPASYLTNSVDVDAQLRAKVSAGSASPASVAALLAEQRERLDTVAAEWNTRRAAVQDAIAATDAALRPAPEGVI